MLAASNRNCVFVFTLPFRKSINCRHHVQWLNIDRCVCSHFHRPPSLALFIDHNLNDIVLFSFFHLKNKKWKKEQKRCNRRTKSYLIVGWRIKHEIRAIRKENNRIIAWISYYICFSTCWFTFEMNVDDFITDWTHFGTHSTMRNDKTLVFEKLATWIWFLLRNESLMVQKRSFFLSLSLMINQIGYLIKSISILQRIYM